MRAAVAAAVARFGRIDGAIHAAGVAGGGIIALKTRDAAERVLAPKVRGLEVLARALADQPVQFVVLCSSLAALAGGLGQVDYCAANAFLDSWAESRHPLAAPLVCSIDWDIWREVGMAVHSAVPEPLQAARAEQLRFGITPAEGVDVFRRILALGLPRVVVSTLALERRLSTAPQVIAPRRPAARHPRPALQTPFAEARTPRERQLADVWQQILGIESVGLHDNFFDLGGDSLTALRLVAQLKADHGLHCAVADFYSAPTIKLLVDRIGAERVSTL
jgi:acyl carrier protein